jgi:hypothetical protein
MRLLGPLQSDRELMERMRQERRTESLGERIFFPEEPELSKTAYAGRRWAPLQEAIQPGYVLYGKTYFEQKNTERYGWDLGVLQPALSALHFYADAALFPYHVGTRPLQPYEANTGYCLPGDPVPLMLYPHEFSWTGLAAEAAAVGAVLVAFP